jgi:hypothetical protein
MRDDEITGLRGDAPKVDALAAFAKPLYRQYLKISPHSTNSLPIGQHVPLRSVEVMFAVYD